MGFIEVENDNGEFVPWEFVDADIKLDIELALLIKGAL